MSFPTRNMNTTDTTPHAMNVSLTHEHLPQMLRQSNYLASGDMRTANVNFRVKPHIDTGAAPTLVQREQQELYPTQSTSRQQQVLYPTQSSLQQPMCEHEHDWSKHEIVTTVAGLGTKLKELDSEIRTGVLADAGGAVMRQVQDHANLLRDNAKQLSATQAKHKETNILTHKICAKMHENAQQQSTALDECNDTISKLKARQSSSVGLMHDICSELHKGLLEHGEDRQSLQRDVALLQQKDVVAQALLGKMLTMLDQHESVVSLDKSMSHEHQALLDGLIGAFEKTKSKMQSFEQAQQEMQRVVADFKANRLAPAAHDAEAIEAKLDRYMRVNKDIDGRCSEALQQHGAKIDELQRTHQQALHSQQMKMQQLERAHQQAIDEQQSKLQMLERKVGRVADLEGRVQELALQQLNASQGSSISRVLERDVKHLQHEMRQFHTLKKDVEAMHEATQLSVSSVQTDLGRLQSDNKARNEHSMNLHQQLEDVKSSVTRFAHGQQTAAVDKSIAELNSKMLDMRRDMTLEKIRADKTASSLHDMHCKLAA